MSSVGPHFNIAGFPSDIIVLIVLAVALFLIGLFYGKRASISFLVALYIARTIIVAAPSLRGFFLRFGLVLPAQTNAMLFVFSVMGITWLLSGGALGDVFKTTSRGLKNWWQIAIASILGAGLFGVLFFPLIPKDTLMPSGALSLWLLANPMPFIWVLAPIFFLIVIRTDK